MIGMLRFVASILWLSCLIAGRGVSLAGIRLVNLLATNTIQGPDQDSVWIFSSGNILPSGNFVNDESNMVHYSEENFISQMKACIFTIILTGS